MHRLPVGQQPEEAEGAQVLDDGRVTVPGGWGEGKADLEAASAERLDGGRGPLGRVLPDRTTAVPAVLLRNVGNVIPRQDLPGGTLAAVEYAVEVLEVEQIIVCGHTQCGAMDAVLHPERTAELPFVSLWLSQTERVREVICERYGHLDAAARLTAAAEENVLAQLENLADIPFVARRLADGRLRLSGWVFDIATGEVHVYDPLADEFLPLGSP